MASTILGLSRYKLWPLGCCRHLEMVTKVSEGESSPNSKTRDAGKFGAFPSRRAGIPLQKSDCYLFGAVAQLLSRAFDFWPSRLDTKQTT